ncbi:MAG: CBASS cGAMP-activated phospholipase [Isosphaeraceae bacterium]|nr:CBASS cGAMP-activated phospholipase [Isosphaeraceae bacterium]
MSIAAVAGTGAPPRFRILSIDGGGIKGAYAAGFLDGVEQRVGAPIHRFFDLIAGTSTGGIIAVMLALGFPASKVVEMYRQHGERIFQRRKRRRISVPLQWLPNRVLNKAGLDWDALQRSKYDSVALREAASSVLQEATLDSAKTRLIVPSIRTSLGRVMVFRTPHFPNQVRDRHLTGVDVILATTAAPTYFPPHWIDNEAAPGQYVDGGLWANNPAMLAYAEAVRIGRDCSPGFRPEDLMILSLGTGDTPMSQMIEASKSGVFGWAPHLISVMMASQSQGTHRMLRYLLGEKKYHRISFVHCKQGWELDAVEKLELLVANGRAEARNLVDRIPSGFFDGPAPPFEAFP